MNPTGCGSTCPKTMRTFKCFWSRWKLEAKLTPWRVITASSTRLGPLQCRAPAYDWAPCSAEPLLMTGRSGWGRGHPVPLLHILTPTLCWRHQKSSSHMRLAHQVHMTSFLCTSISLSGVGWQQGQGLWDVRSSWQGATACRIPPLPLVPISLSQPDSSLLHPCPGRS